MEREREGTRRGRRKGRGETRGEVGGGKGRGGLRVDLPHLLGVDATVPRDLPSQIFHLFSN